MAMYKNEKEKPKNREAGSTYCRSCTDEQNFHIRQCKSCGKRCATIFNVL